MSFSASFSDQKRRESPHCCILLHSLVERPFSEFYAPTTNELFAVNTVGTDMMAMAEMTWISGTHGGDGCSQHLYLFFQTTFTNITCLYQCHSDLSHNKCNTCVQKLTNTIQTSCYGCYMWYEVDVYHVDYPPVNELWHEECGVRAGTGTDFDVFTTLISQSSTTNFFQTTITNITCLYQCRI